MTELIYTMITPFIILLSFYIGYKAGKQELHRANIKKIRAEIVDRMRKPRGEVYRPSKDILRRMSADGEQAFEEYSGPTEEY